MCVWPPVANKLYLGGGQSHSNCTRVTVSRMQIVHAWPPVACKIKKKWWEFVCDWRPRGYNLHATGGHSGKNYPYVIFRGLGEDDTCAFKGRYNFLFLLILYLCTPPYPASPSPLLHTVCTVLCCYLLSSPRAFYSPIALLYNKVYLCSQVTFMRTL